MSSVYQTTVITGPNEENLRDTFEYLSRAVSFAMDNSQEGDWITIEEVLQDSCGDYELVEEVLSFQRERDL